MGNTVTLKPEVLPKYLLSLGRGSREDSLEKHKDLKADPHFHNLLQVFSSNGSKLVAEPLKKVLEVSAGFEILVLLQRVVSGTREVPQLLRCNELLPPLLLKVLAVLRPQGEYV